MGNTTLFAKGHDPRRWKGGFRPPTVTTPEGKVVTLAELAREATWEAVGVLRQCVNDKRRDMNTRCRAAGYLLALGWGAAPKEATLRLVTNNDVAVLSDAELVQLAQSVRGPSMPTIDVEASDAG